MRQHRLQSTQDSKCASLLSLQQMRVSYGPSLHIHRQLCRQRNFQVLCPLQFLCLPSNPDRLGNHHKVKDFSRRKARPPEFELKYLGHCDSLRYVALERAPGLPSGTRHNSVKDHLIPRGRRGCQVRQALRTQCIQGQYPVHNGCFLSTPVFINAYLVCMGC